MIWNLTFLLGQVLLNPPPDPGAIRVDVEIVNVYCSVRGRDGAWIKDLSKQDFEIRDEGKPVEVKLFARETDAPLSLAMLLDVSGSVATFIASEKETAAKFITGVMRPGDKALLAGFDDRIAIWKDFTESADALRTALEASDSLSFNRPRAPRPRGGTLLLDAVNLVSQNKLKPRTGRKTLVILSDGLDSGSIVKLDGAVKAAQQADTVIYAILVGDEEESEGFKVLRKVAEPTGGRAFRIAKKTTLESIFQEIHEEMRSQYGLGYTPPTGAPGTFRKLEVKVSRPGARVQARTGYYSR